MREQFAGIICDKDLMNEVHWRDLFILGEVHWWDKDGNERKEDCYLFLIPQPNAEHRELLASKLWSIFSETEGATG